MPPDTIEKFVATIEDWATTSEEMLKAIVSQAANDLMFGASETVTGTSLGAEFVEGKVPRGRTGNLAASLTSTLNGAQLAEGETSYSTVVGQIEVGDYAEFVWGAGAAAAYVMRVHYGFTGTDSLGRQFNQPGRYWVPAAARDWQGIVTEAVRKVRG